MKRILNRRLTGGLLGAAFGIAALAGTAAAIAEPAPELHMFIAGPPEGGPAGFFEQALREIGASDAQRAQIDTIRASFKPQLKAAFDELRINRETAHGLDSQASDFLVSANQLADEHGQLAAQIDRLMAAMRQQTEAVLTADQRARLQAAKVDLLPRLAMKRERIELE
jgi:Spy/CpxP family protein refolding chaperone